ncbi:MAG: hypothetical protein WCV56_04930 [Candidatus Omnitrophota bacterium]
MRRSVGKIVEFFNLLRDTSAIPLFIIWSLIVSLGTANLDRLPNMILVTWNFNILKFMPLLLLLIRKPVWKRALFAIGFCGMYAIFIIGFMPKVPYDAPGSMWMGMISFFTYIAPVTGLFILYGISEILVNFVRSITEMRSTRIAQLLTFIVFVVVTSLTIVLNPFLMGIVQNETKNIMVNKGHFLVAGHIELKVPEKYIRDYKQERIEINGDYKGRLYRSDAGEFVYILETRFIEPEISREAFKTRKDEIYETIKKGYEDYFRRNKDITHYDFISTDYKSFPDLVRMGYRTEFDLDGKDHVKLGLVIVVHNRIYIDIGVQGLKNSYENGSMQKKFNDFISSLKIGGNTE